MSALPGSKVPRHLIVLDSSNVASVGYAIGLRVMEVVYKSSNTLYAYHNVTPDMFAAMCSATSIGRWLKTNIVDDPRYPFDRVNS